MCSCAGCGSRRAEWIDVPLLPTIGDGEGVLTIKKNRVANLLERSKNGVSSYHLQIKGNGSWFAIEADTYYALRTILGMDVPSSQEG